MEFSSMSLRFAAFVLIGFFAQQSVSAEPTAISWSSTVQELESNDPRVRDKAYVTLSKDHDRVVGQLIKILMTPRDEYDPNSDPRHFAALLLGRIGGKSCLPALIDNVDFEQPNVFFTTRSRLNGYPCALALRDIGPTVLPAIIEYLRQPMTPIYEGHFVVDRKSRDQPVSDKAIELFAVLLMTPPGTPNDVMDRAREQTHNKPDLERVWEKIQQLSRKPERPAK
jgi:hypothetical protein